jgi:DHA1 family multidrug resistance protein-like MFS transporter
MSPAIFNVTCCITFPNVADSWDFLLAILYASLESFALEYGRFRGWGPVVSQLPFLSLLIGCLFAAAANIFNNIYYGKKLVANNFKPVPEARLPPMMVGGFAFSSGLFLFGCKSQYSLAEPPRTCMTIIKLWR